MQRIRVVLPQPLAPAINKISPGPAEKETSRMAGVARSRYRKLSFSITSGVSVVMDAYSLTPQFACRSILHLLPLEASRSNDLNRYYFHHITNLCPGELCRAAVDDGQLQLVLAVQQGHQFPRGSLAIGSHQASHLVAAQPEEQVGVIRQRSRGQIGG